MPNRYKPASKPSDIVVAHPPGELHEQIGQNSFYTLENLVFDKAKDKDRENLFLGTADKTDNLKYQPKPNSAAIDFEEIGQSTSRLINNLELERDENGFTHPNLHRRIDPTMPEAEYEIAPRKYRLHINKWNSYRTTHVITHIDYMDLDDYSDDENYLIIKARFDESEKKEIP